MSDEQIRGIEERADGIWRGEVEYQLADDISALIAAVRRLRGERDELRAILAVPLETPWISTNGGEVLTCSLCFASWRLSLTAVGQHRPDCPVLRADELLGRDRAPAPPEGP